MEVLFIVVKCRSNNYEKDIQISDLTLKNTEICPAVYNIIEALKIKLPV